MNLLFVTRFYPDSRIGGIERVTGILARYFHQQGIAVHCLFFEKSDYDGSLGEIVQAHHLVDLYNKVWLKEYLLNHQIDIVINQSHFFYTPFLASVAHEVGAKLITCCHSSTSMKTLDKNSALKQSRGLKKMVIGLVYPLFRAWSERKLKRIHQLSFENSDQTIVLSKSIKDEYASNLGINPNNPKLGYISNPLSFAGEISEEEIKQKENIVLVVARLYEPQKRLSLLFDVWKQVQRDDRKLIVVGDGEDRELYEKIVSDLQLKNVSFEGVQNPLPYYRKAKIFAMTSSWEGLPMTILESLQMGVVPIVLDSFAAAKDMIEDGVNGFLVKDKYAFARNMNGLMVDALLWKKMSFIALSSSCNYQMSEIGNNWLNLFKRL